MALITCLRKTHHLILFRAGSFFKRDTTKTHVSSTTEVNTEVIFLIGKRLIVIDHFKLQLHHVLGHTLQVGAHAFLSLNHCLCYSE